MRYTLVRCTPVRYTPTVVWGAGVAKVCPELNRFTVFTLASDDDVLASSNIMSTSGPHHGQNVAVLLSRTYVFAAFGGH
jgi:hypothetical protein